MIKPERKIIEDSILITIDQPTTLYELRNHLALTDYDISIMGGKNIKVIFGPYDESYDINIQFTRLQTDYEYAETCRRSSAAKKAVAGRRAKNIKKISLKELQDKANQIGYKLVKEE